MIKNNHDRDALQYWNQVVDEQLRTKLEHDSRSWQLRRKIRTGVLRLLHQRHDIRKPQTGRSKKRVGVVQKKLTIFGLTPALMRGHSALGICSSQKPSVRKQTAEMLGKKQRASLHISLEV